MSKRPSQRAPKGYGLTRTQAVLMIALASLLGAVSPVRAEALAVRILSPVDGELVQQPEVTLRVAVRLPPGNKGGRLRTFVDGKLVNEQRGFSVASSAPAVAENDETIQTIAVVIPPQDTLIAVVADGPDQGRNEALVRLRWGGAPAAPFTTKPNLYVLSVGVSRYSQSHLRLDYPAKDAQDLAAAFKEQEGGLYARVSTRVLTDALATKSNILDGLEWLQRQSTARDIAVLFLAGHGINDPATGQYYYLPHEADPQAVKRTMLSQTDVQTTLLSLAGKVLLFLDSCHAGNVLGMMQRGLPDLSSFISELIRAENGVVVFAGSTGRQASQESGRWENGAFTKAVVEGLRGRAAYHPQRPITINMLDLYISERVKELTSGTQTPSTAKPSTVPDFPVAVVQTRRSLPVSAARAPLELPGRSLPAPQGSQQRSPQRSPIYKRAWFWAALFGGIAAVTIIGGVAGGVATRNADLEQIYDLPKVR